MAPRSCLVLTALLMGALSGTAAPGHVWAQTALSEQLPRATPAPAQAAPQALIHVSAAAGSDTAGDGTQMKPLKTITRALRNAAPGTVIVLAPGEYSAATGETFPLQLQPGVTVQGGLGPNRSGVIIQGGGTYLSPSHGMENVAILAVDRAGLGNVLVTNPNAQGHGVWIEAGSPILQDNIFAASGQAGVYIAGPGAAVIQRNYFTENGLAGLVIGGASQAAVLGNVFENTGIGIQVAPGAAPRIQENRIVQNQDGLILQANARPVLENNTIARNRRNGLVEFQSLGQGELISAAQPIQRATSEPTGAVMPTPASANHVVSLDAEPSPAARPAALLPDLEGPGSAAGRPPVNNPSQTALPLTAETPRPEPSAAETSAAVALAADAAVIAAAPSLDPQPTAATGAGPEPRLEASSTRTPVASTAVIREVPPEAPLTPAADATSVPAAALAVTPETDLAAAPAVPPTVSPTVSSAVLPEASLPQAAAPSGNLAALRQRLLDQRSAAESATGGPDTVGDAGVDLAVIPPPAAAAAGPAARPGGNLAALRERLRQQSAGAAADPVTAAVPLAVTPPPADSVAQATGQPVAQAEALPVIPASGSLPAAPSPGVPALPLPSGSLLQVPGPDIPMGSGGALPDVLLSQGGGPSGPPVPPSRSGALGLHYKVFIPAADAVTQDRVRSVVPDAFRVRVNGQLMMQAGAFPDQATADAIASNLTQQGLEAQVQYVP